MSYDSSKLGSWGRGNITEADEAAMLAVVDRVQENESLLNTLRRAAEGNGGKERAKKKRKVTTGVKYGNFGGVVQTTTSTKKAPKKKAKINATKEIRKLKKSAAIERNMKRCHHVEKVVTNTSLSCSINEMSATPAQLNLGNDSLIGTALENVKRRYYGASASGTGTYNLGQLKSALLQLSFNMKTCWKNNDLSPCYLYIYDFVAVDDHSKTPSAVIQEYVEDYQTDHVAAADILKDTRFTFSDGRYLKKFWKTVQFKKVYLKPGDEYWFFMNSKKKVWDDDYDDIEGETYKKWRSHVLFAQVMGVPTHGDTVTNIGLSAVAQVDCIAWIETHVYFDGEDNTMTYHTSGDKIRGNLPATITNAQTAGAAVAEEKTN